ncbi:hypothetical protein ABFS83_02G076600 [Erythranthe nasuta]
MDCPLRESLLHVHYKGMLLNEENTIFYDTRAANKPLEFISGEGLDFKCQKALKCAPGRCCLER